jgi:hypothetical protein
MPSSSPSPAENHSRITSLLTEIVALLTRELAIVANKRWEDLPRLKKDKVVLASRLKSIDWTSDPVGEEPANWSLLKSRIAALENECRQKIQAQIALIRNQMLALQDLHQYWRECLSITFQNFQEPMPAA